MDAFRPAFADSICERTPFEKGGRIIATGTAAVNRDLCYGAVVKEELVVVFTAQGEPEETQVRSFLAAHGIPTSTRGEALRKTHGLTLNGLGQVDVLVAREDADDARKLLADAERGDLALDESSDT